jgi:hypothetical protein
MKSAAVSFIAPVEPASREAASASASCCESGEEEVEEVEASFEELEEPEFGTSVIRAAATPFLKQSMRAAACAARGAEEGTSCGLTTTGSQPRARRSLAAEAARPRRAGGEEEEE